MGCRRRRCGRPPPGLQRPRRLVGLVPGRPGQRRAATGGHRGVRRGHPAVGVRDAALGRGWRPGGCRRRTARGRRAGGLDRVGQPVSGLAGRRSPARRSQWCRPEVRQRVGRVFSVVGCRPDRPGRASSSCGRGRVVDLVAHLCPLRRRGSPDAGLRRIRMGPRGAGVGVGYRPRQRQRPRRGRSRPRCTGVGVGYRPRQRQRPRRGRSRPRGAGVGVGYRPRQRQRPRRGRSRPRCTGVGVGYRPRRMFSPADRPTSPRVGCTRASVPARGDHVPDGARRKSCGPRPLLPAGQRGMRGSCRRAPPRCW